MKVELDEGSSWSDVSMSVTAHSIVWNPLTGEPPEVYVDSDSWSGSGTQYEGLSEVNQEGHGVGYCESSVVASVSVSSHALSAFPNPDEQSIEGQELYDIRFSADANSWPCPAPEPFFFSIFASFDCELSAAGEIVWELLPSTEDEEIGMPVIVFFDPVHYSVGGASGGNTVYEFRIYDWEYGVIGQEMEGPYEVASYADPPDYEVTPVPDWEDLIIHASIGDKIKLHYKMEGYAYTQDDLVPTNLTPDGDHPTMGLSLGVWVKPAEEKISIEDPVWSGESDRMVLPYDKVNLDFVVHNHSDTGLSNVDVEFEPNTTDTNVIIKFEKSTKSTGPIPAGGSTKITNTIKVAGLENDDIMKNVIKNLNGTLSLKDAITATVVGGESFILSPKDESNEVLAIQYPDFMRHSPDVTDPYGDIGDFYNRGGGDAHFHHPENSLVREYAIKASLGTDNVFPDDVVSIVGNIYQYIDKHVPDDADWWLLTDVEIAEKLPNAVIQQPCISQAYLLGSFARTIGVPAREMDVALGISILQIGPAVFGVRYGQEAAIQVWYDKDWHLYDTFMEITSWDSYLQGKCIKYRAWHSYDRRNDKVWDFLGHDFSINEFFGTPGLFSGWKHLQDGVKEGLTVVIGSPVHTYLSNPEGNRTGYVEGEVVEEIPDSYYLPAGTRISTNRANSSAFWEADETIFVAQSGQSGEYSLVMTGTDNGHYELILAYIHRDGEIDGSTIQFDIRKYEPHMYDIAVSSSGEISITSVPSHIDFDPDTLNLKAPLKYVT
ncbi:MAG: hypothetical protein KAV87_26670, partial [Desulfobacteraceae bacterium]|nr:hypothetical protein [Desulfobacteraceae bacterium]